MISRRKIGAEETQQADIMGDAAAAPLFRNRSGNGLFCGSFILAIQGIENVPLFACVALIDEFFQNVVGFFRHLRRLVCDVFARNCSVFLRDETDDQCPLIDFPIFCVGEGNTAKVRRSRFRERYTVVGVNLLKLG